MEKLKQFQKYQFWALLVAALVLPFVAWSMARGMIPLTADRTSELTKLRDSLKSGGNDDPNTEWARQANLINAEQEKQKDLAWRSLYERQKPFMVWPKNVNPDPEKMLPRDLQVYRLAYPKEVVKVWKIVKPTEDEDEDAPVGLVEYSYEMLPRPDTEWELQAPSPSKIVAAQEDLWLLTAILTAVASVNEGTTTPFDAPIRKIEELILRGGSKVVAAAPAPKAPGPPGQQGPPPGFDPRPAAKPGAGGTKIADAKIKADEDLGPERVAAEVKAPEPPGGPKVPGGPPGGPPAGPPAGPGPAMDRGGGLAGNRWSSPNMNRYCDEQKEWKTRGFSLEVVMDLQSVPDLLVALSNCKGWSINVLRVHEADRKDNDLIAPDAGGRPPVGGGAPLQFPPEGGPKPGVGAGPRPNTRSPLDDENLATVSIVGVIYIFNKPPEAPVVEPAPAAPGGPAAVPPAATPGAPADPATEKPEPEGEPGEATEESADSAVAPEKSGAEKQPKPPSENGAAGSK